jgi:hypothetical protein
LGSLKLDFKLRKTLNGRPLNGGSSVFSAKVSEIIDVTLLERSRILTECAVNTTRICQRFLITALQL